LGNLTGGLYNTQTLLQGNNAVCFAFQALQLGAPDMLKPLLADLNSAFGILTGAIGRAISGLGYPQSFGTLDESKLSNFLDGPC